MRGLLAVVLLVLSLFPTISGFVSPCETKSAVSLRTGPLPMAQITETEARKGIEKVVNALRKDSQATEELGRLEKVTKILGYGSPDAGAVALRFNAAFKKGGFGRSSVPLPFGLGQSEEPEGRGTMVGQVKASVDQETGKVLSCSVFRDLGYGRSFVLKV
mmetsp:Transcript_29358/g.67964  ORF Transcript_29358/g.67964 Transcript_29358/m.67964 type:complete len:160 (+) Transcript_29358:52-531(+)|eukprot:CAMPEP_0116863610 /NCGR_PEP_ID=MMETSP0418-20121206/24331_1 /TAXON_ID=1158023 /ORGANISM="Astrosyne radiata, Strain 13vi08-1A" /LENGTH=159 /DNA_ID=CAMNT_0004498677 /DNA_START=18 /DNA_END=497 /DNA_ORIENTATION=+